MAMTYHLIPRVLLFTKQPTGIVIETNLDPTATRIDITIDMSLTGSFGTGEFTSVTISEIPDADGIAKFDLQGILDEFMNNEWDGPTEGYGGAFENTNCPVHVLVSVFEMQGTAVQSSDLFNDVNNAGDPYLALQGGIDRRHAVRFNQDYFAINEGNRFHSWKGLYRVFDKQSRNFLYFFNRAYDGDIEMRIQLYDDNDGLISASLIATTFVAKKLYHFAPTYQFIQTIFAIGDAFKYFTFDLLDAIGDPISESITFYYDKKYYRNKLYLFYQNSLNAFEDVRFTGERITGGEYERQVAQMSGDIVIPTGVGHYIAYTHEGGSRKTIDAREYLTTKVFTNYLSEAQISNLRELLISPRIFINEDDLSLTPENWTHRQVELTEKTKALISSADYEKGIQLEFRDVESNRVWTPLSFYP